jgi:hypothetical protein
MTLLFALAQASSLSKVHIPVLDQEVFQAFNSDQVSTSLPGLQQ